MILGLSGKASSGKDTTADYLIDHFAWDSKIALASNLKEACKIIFNLSDDQVLTQKGKRTSFQVPVLLSDFHVSAVVNWINRTHSVHINDVDYTKYLGLELNTPRDVLQFVGTELMRSYCDSYHIDVIMGKLRYYNNVAITDVRFKDEAEAVKAANGKLVRIERDANLRGVSSNHLSETALDNWGNWDYILYNNSSFCNLYSQIDKMIENIK